jgi:hypothetical protein
MKIIYVFGNADIKADSLPIKLLPELKKKFPSIHFSPLEPYETFPNTRMFWLMDTVIGLKRVTLLTNLGQFLAAKGLSTHDYDLGLELKLLVKLNKIKQVKVIGIPPQLSEPKVILELCPILSANGF